MQLFKGKSSDSCPLVAFRPTLKAHPKSLLWAPVGALKGNRKQTEADFEDPL